MASAYLPLFKTVRHRLAGPHVIILGSPRAAADLAAAINDPNTVCFQFDRYQADRLGEELGANGRVEVAADLWDLPATYGAAVFPSPEHGERELKLDIVEQAFHVLKPKGTLAVLSPVPKDQLFPAAMKKVFGKVALETDRSGTALWSARDGDRKRRRHESTFSAKVRPGEYVNLVSRPGLFAYGRLDDGTRSLLDVFEIRGGERVVDLGCGSGAAGIVAVLRGASGGLTLADSNARAVQVAGLNANTVGVDADAVLTANFRELADGAYDLALANPPYFAAHGVSRLFVESARRVLRPGGRLYLVTRQPEPVAPIVEESFGPPLVLGRRDYAVIVASRPA